MKKPSLKKRKVESKPPLGNSAIPNAPESDADETRPQRPMKRQRLSSDKKLLLGIL